MASKIKTGAAMDWRKCAFIDTEGYPWLPPLCCSSLLASRPRGGTGCLQTSHHHLCLMPTYIYHYCTRR